MEDNKEGVSVSFAIRSLILHFTYIYTACILAILTHPLYYISALDSENEARYYNGVRSCMPRNRQVGAYTYSKKKAKATIGERKMMNNTS